jgi:hypothetical protein
MKAKILAVVLLLAALLLSGSACGGKGLEMSAEEIIAAAMAAEAEIESYQFNAVVDIKAVDEVEKYTMTGIIDEPNRELYIGLQMSMIMPEPMEMDTEMYILGDWAYTGGEVDGLGTPWRKVRLTEELWGQVSRQVLRASSTSDLSLIMNSFEGVSMELLGTEVMEGVECYKLSVTPDLGNWSATFLDQPGWDLIIDQQGLEYMDPDLIEEALKELITDLSNTYWIAKDTYFTVKAIGNTTMTILLATVDIDSTMLKSHINELVTIELPPEAEDAVEVSPPYDGAKEQVEIGVTDYIARTYGYLPTTGAVVTMGDTTYDIIDICPLLYTYAGAEGPGILMEAPVSCVEDAAFDDNCANCGGYCSATAHYIWLLSPEWDVASQCKNTAANGGGCFDTNSDGFQGIYP